mmetsp:Transcript_20475/g.28370  ORF Transcript_20475/g.28370 Transcript_20475/m.28370 type:complete len:183 (+) Transcript_20475:104-652(+)|eukprot:CAMPEP_0196572792 /NCGR_PEP_ID=MMETSP1081-20130531/2776_1 /TAXON_ID=36882 /ORGANISM="Pyramimonas amylifera, Strain CCMP720" /LENGTH=182 /DNA_ID=CAMNT_0041890227 /DNA_START=75 /DNA_END=623 /DNA_ORIENTATION=-
MASSGTAQMAMQKVSESAKHVLAQRRPWSEIVDRTAYAKPANFADASSRIRKNINYFKVNYVLFVLGVLIACLLTHPVSMFLLMGLGTSWVYLFVVRTEPLVINGRSISEREKLIGMASVSVILIFFVSSVGSVIFMGLGIGLAGVAIHGSLRVPDDLFLDENNENDGFFSFIKPPNSQATI